MPLIDPDLPSFLFECHTCKARIPDPDKAVAEGLAKGGGFTSMKVFCSSDCADATVVEAALLHLDGDDPEPELDVNGDLVRPSDDLLNSARGRDLPSCFDDLWEEWGQTVVAAGMTRLAFEAHLLDDANWSAWSDVIDCKTTVAGIDVSAQLDTSSGTCTFDAESGE